MVEWGGHHGGWGGFGPPSYIVKKCPDRIYRHRCAQDMGNFFYVVILTLDELIT